MPTIKIIYLNIVLTWIASQISKNILDKLLTIMAQLGQNIDDNFLFKV